MRGNPAYTAYHPRWIRRRVSTYWWLGRWAYLKFILRELSSLFVAWFVVVLLWLIAAVADGPRAYAAFLEWAREPWVLALNLVSSGFVLLHAVTWFNLAPAAIVAHVGSRKVPGAVIAGSNYAAWVAASALVAWLLVGA